MNRNRYIAISILLIASGLALIAHVSVPAVASQGLGEKAASLAKEVVGAPYLWGGKGWDFNDNKFVDSEDIRSGYTYWDSDSKSTKVGSGLDCSGLVYWSFNKAARIQKHPTKVPDECPIYFEGANEQWSDTKRLQQLGGPTDIPSESDLKPGDLLFLDTEDKGLGVIDHVGMYVGDGEVVHAKGTGKIESVKLIDWFNLPYDDKKYEDYFAGYGRVIASGIINTNPQKGDRVYISAGDTKYPLWSANAVTITDIENGFLCVQETFPGSDGKTYTENYCMGIETINRLTWAD